MFATHFKRPALGFFGLSLLALANACPAESENVAILFAELDARPSAVSFDPLYAGGPMLRRVQVTNVGRATLPVDVAVLNANGPALFTVRSSADTLKPGETATLTIGAEASLDVVGSALATLRLKADGMPDSEIAIFASIRSRPACDDGNPCTVDTFDTDTQACGHDAEPDYLPCDDGNACTEVTICRAGQCVGDAITCDDDIPCTADRCEPATGCVFETVPERCEDADPCTADICSPTGGCSNPPLDEGAVCASDGCSSYGVCQTGVCNHYPTPDGAPCDDGDVCTSGDTCSAGECAAGETTGVGETPPVEVGLESVVVDHCSGHESPGTCFGGIYLSPSKVLAVAEVPGYTYVVWRTAFVDENSFACFPTSPPSQGPTDPVPGGDMDGARAEIAPLGDCAATVALTTTSSMLIGLDTDGDEPLAQTTILQTVRGPVGASVYVPNGNIDRFAISLPPSIIVASANTKTTALWVDYFNLNGLLTTTNRATYQVHHVNNNYDFPEPDLVVLNRGTDAILIGNTANPGSCPNCSVYSHTGATQEMRLWKFAAPQFTTNDTQPGGAPIPEEADQDNNQGALEQFNPNLTSIGASLFFPMPAAGLIDCFSPVTQTLPDATLIQNEFNGVTFTFRADTDGCGGNPRTWSVDLDPDNPSTSLLSEIDEDAVGTIYGIGSSRSSSGQVRVLFATEPREGCISLAVDEECFDPSLDCSTPCGSVREWRQSDDGPPVTYPVHNVQGAQFFPMEINGQSNALSNQYGQSTLHTELEMSPVLNFTPSGASWLPNSIRTAHDAGRLIAGVLAPAFQTFPDTQPAVECGDGSVDGDGLCAGDQPPPPPDVPEEEPEPPVPPPPPLPRLGLQFLGCGA